MSVFVPVKGYVHMSASARGGHKRSMDPLELWFLAIVSYPALVLGSELSFSAGEERILKH